MAFPKFINTSTAARWALTALLAAALSSCGRGGSSTPGPEAVFTSAAQTAQARSTEMFVQTPTTDPASMVATIAAPSPTPGEVVITPATPSGQATQAQPTAAGTGATQAAPPACTSGDAALYVADVNIPDGTTFAPGETFEKTWRIQNSGTTTWSIAYSLVFIDGNVMGAQTKIPMPNEVAPGEEVEISVPMVAPEKPGSYTSYWKMSTANGALFGFGATGIEAIWIKITVSGDFSTPQSAAPTGPALVVSDAQLAIDNAAAVGPCPYTFNFNGLITLSKAATVTYLLEAGTEAGDTMRTPLPTTRNLDQGTHPIVYELTIPGSFAGWARLHVTAPIDMTSEPVNFTLSCG